MLHNRYTTITKNNTITKAVIACAGWSTRFLPSVKTYAKPLLPIVDRPQIQQIIESLITAGISEIMIVHRHGEESLQKYFQLDSELEEFLTSVNKQHLMESWHTMVNSLKKIEFAPQTPDFPYGNGTPILVAQKFIGDDPFVYLYGDDIVIENKPGTFLSKMIAIFNQHHPSAITATQLMTLETISNGGSVKYTQNSPIPYQMDFAIEKPKPEEVQSLYMICSPFILTPKIIDALKNTAITRGELWLTNALNTLAKTDVVMAPPIENGHYATTGDPLNWLKVNIELALRHPQIGPKLQNFLDSIKK